jgi:uncharacterized protein (TIGR00255 family)
MALSGMTGFARVEGSAGAWRWAVEARSVNGRNLEARFRGPPGFDSLERVARDGAQGLFQRGQITIGLQAKRAESVGQVRVNLDQIERYIELLAPLIAAGRALPPSADGLLALRGVLEVSEEVEEAEVKALVEQAMAASITDALLALQASRRDEGAALAPVLSGLVDRIEMLVSTAEGQAAGQPAAIKERFTKRMTELAGDGAGVAERIVTEAAAMAVKADVREELDRLVSHIQAARTLLSSDASSGRRLDFLMQEFMREANTLCSKSALTNLTATGLDLKATIEQLREQVQNVE